jgi:hydroxymethylpyrimidine pyrophosphatase-like HAD family hydrolase
VPENKVVDFFEHSPKLGWKLAKLLALRLQQMNEKLDHIVAEIPEENEEQAEERFKELTATSYHRAFLDLYKKRVGKSLSLKDLLHELDTPAPEMNRILMVFGMAGLIDLRDRTVSFRECADRALSLKINTWNKQ